MAVGGGTRTPIFGPARAARATPSLAPGAKVKIPGLGGGSGLGAAAKNVLSRPSRPKRSGWNKTSATTSVPSTAKLGGSQGPSSAGPGTGGY